MAQSQIHPKIHATKGGKGVGGKLEKKILKKRG